MSPLCTEAMYCQSHAYYTKDADYNSLSDVGTSRCQKDFLVGIWEEWLDTLEHGGDTW